MRLINKIRKLAGFTLIELLIVVAIIAILAAIAVPNFLEAQTRSKTSRAKSDMRTISIALESFYIDRNFYPCDGFVGYTPLSDGFQDLIRSRYEQTWGYQSAAEIATWEPRHLNFWFINDSIFLTTPIAYMSSFPKDPFSLRHQYFKGQILYMNAQDRNKDNSFADLATGGSGNVAPWSPDPNTDFPTVDGKRTPSWYLQSFGPDAQYNLEIDLEEHLPYDPTNGTVSFGDIFRAGP